jgi:hypothetical protein
VRDAHLVNLASFLLGLACSIRPRSKGIGGDKILK